MEHRTRSLPSFAATRMCMSTPLTSAEVVGKLESFWHSIQPVIRCGSQVSRPLPTSHWQAVAYSLLELELKIIFSSNSCETRSQFLLQLIQPITAARLPRKN